MISRKAIEVFKKILGSKEPSESRLGEEFTIFPEGSRLTCECEDFVFRGGSYRIEYRDEEKHWHYQRSCKHIAKHLRRRGLKVRIQNLVGRNVSEEVAQI